MLCKVSRNHLALHSASQPVIQGGGFKGWNALPLDLEGIKTAFTRERAKPTASAKIEWKWLKWDRAFCCFGSGLSGLYCIVRHPQWTQGLSGMFIMLWSHPNRGPPLMSFIRKLSFGWILLFELIWLAETEREFIPHRSVQMPGLWSKECPSTTSSGGHAMHFHLNHSCPKCPMPQNPLPLNVATFGGGVSVS